VDRETRGWLIFVFGLAFILMGTISMGIYQNEKTERFKIEQGYEEVMGIGHTYPLWQKAD